MAWLPLTPGSIAYPGRMDERLAAICIPRRVLKDVQRVLDCSEIMPVACTETRPDG